ncbi:MAG TPA: serine--tRNA ligase [Bacteroidetes bacterium]|nr:serine--tRNA ligase [Bacteroidota bacterium]
MLPLRLIISSPEQVVETLKVKNFDASEIVKKIIQLDQSRRNLQKQIDDLKADQNKLAKEVGSLYKAGKQAEADSIKQKSLDTKEQIKVLEDKFAPIDKELDETIVLLPNLPHSSVPKGKSAEQNELVRSGGDIPHLPENKLPHWDIAQKFNLIDFELGNKITGSGFPLYIGKGAKLQRALISFFLDQAEKAGFIEYMPPLMVNEDTAYATGQLPDKEGQMYVMERDNFYMIPTAEVPLTNIYRDVILSEEQLPIKLTGYTPCFRREAGSYGKEVRGLNRLHQFDKVEIVCIANPEKSYEVLDQMVSYVETLVKSLELPYRIVKLCGGDMSFTSALTYDFEVFSAGQDKWLEVSSVSNFEFFQANRLKLRYKSKNLKSTQLAHTLNGSALALPRIVAALLENNQTEKGIKIPKVLIPYTGFDII